MDPFFVRNRLSDYLENDVDEETRNEIAQALSEDAALQEEFENLQNTQSLLRKYGMEEPSPAFFNNVMEAIEEDVPRIYHWKKWAQVTTLIAAGILVAILGVDSFQETSTPTANQVQGGSFEIPTTTTAESPPDFLVNKNFQIPISKPEVVAKPVKTKVVPAKKAEKKRVKPSKKPVKSAPQNVLPETSQVKQGSITIPSLSTSPPIVSIRTKDSNILFTLLSLAEQHQGSLLLESNRKPLQAVKMTEDDTFRAVMLSVSTENLQELTTQINQIGGEIDQIGQQGNDQKATIFLDITYEY